MQLRGMIFDMDGTLCDTLPACVAALQHVFSRHLRREYAAEEILAMFGPTEEGIIQRLMPEGYEPAVADFMAEYERLHDGHDILFPGIERALRLLQERGILLGVVTGKGSATAAITLRHAGLESAFDIVQAGSAAGGVKPQSLRAVLDRWQLPAGAVAYAGDSPSDMADAIEVGVIPLGAGWAAISTVQDPACRRSRTVLRDCGAQITFASVDRLCEWIEAEC